MLSSMGQTLRNPPPGRRTPALRRPEPRQQRFEGNRALQRGRVGDLDTERAPRAVKVVEVRAPIDRAARPKTTPEPIRGTLADTGDPEPSEDETDRLRCVDDGGGDVAGEPRAPELDSLAASEDWPRELRADRQESYAVSIERTHAAPFSGTRCVDCGARATTPLALSSAIDQPGSSRRDWRISIAATSFRPPLVKSSMSFAV